MRVPHQLARLLTSVPASLCLACLTFLAVPLVVVGTLGMAARPAAARTLSGKPQQARQAPQRAGRPATSRRLALDHDLVLRCEALCRKAVAGLLRLQGETGSFRLGDAINPAPLAVDALGLLALLATGAVPGRGKAGKAAERVLHALIMRQDRSGSATHGYFRADGDEFSKMHGHGYASLALSQALGMLPPDERALVPQKAVRESLIAATRLIAKSQDRSGGWSYDPRPLDHEGSMTICMIQALRGARDAGIFVDRGVIRRALSYVERSQKPDGSFRYKLGVERSSVALTAAAVMTLQAGGSYQSAVLRKGMAFLTDQGALLQQSRSSPLRRARAKSQRSFPYYERLYIAEALFSAQEQASFVRWFRREVARFENSIDAAKGSWQSERYGEAYATAMSLLVLSLPFQYLPIHQR